MKETIIIIIIIIIVIIINLTFTGPYIVNVSLTMTNKMQRCIIRFIIINALHVSSGFSAHHQELKYVHAALGICQISNNTCKPVPTHPR
jgi:hypothetical protein